MTQTLTVHHLDNSRSQRILWLCEELGLEYTIVKHWRHGETLRAPASLSALHALGKAPVIEHRGRCIVETDAVIEYICNVCAGGRLSRPPDADDYGAYLQWLAFSEGTLFPGLGVDLISTFTACAEQIMPFFGPEIAKNHQYLENALEGREYILPSGFSAADVNLGWTLEFSEARGRLKTLPRCQAYLARLRARPAYRRALERGGPQDLSIYSQGAS